MYFRERFQSRFCGWQLCLIVVLTGLIPTLASAEWFDLGGAPVAVDVIEYDGQRTVYEVSVGGFDAEPVEIDGRTYFEITLEREGISLDAGFPSLPSLRRGLIIPDDRQMAVTIIASEYVDVPDLPVAPSKGNLLRSVDPATVPYVFDAFYQGSGVYPAATVAADDPHIVRDFRGMVVGCNSFQYFPATETLRVYTRVRIEVAPVGSGTVNVLERNSLPAKMDPQFVKLYQNHFINYQGSRYTPVLEDGGLLIISYDAFAPYVQPLVEWKMQKGIPTKLATLSETGSSYSQIKSYIGTEFASWEPSYVLLIGDAAQLPRYGSDSDPGYSTLVGGDNYPELFVGRFSAENATQVQTQVERTITYERDQMAGGVWPQYGMGVASNQGPGDDGEYDDEHEDVIRQKLLNYGYLGVDQIYDPSGTAAQVTAGLNTGRGIVNYTGHGSQTSWGSTGFSNTHVNALVNDNMLPFIVSVACNNGTFDSGTCFAEAWQRATNGGTPTGAIASYMSYISQSWNPPMAAQDEAVDLLVADQMRTIGGLWFNGSCLMMDEYGTSGENEFLNWTIFGDPSIAVRTKAAQVMTVNHAGALIIGQNTYDVSVPGVTGALCALYADGILYGTGVTDHSGNTTIVMDEPPATVVTLTLTVTAYNMVTVQNEVPALPPEGPYLVLNTCTVMDPDGDVDGELDEGESADLEISLENVGVEPATAVSAVLSSADANVTVVDGSATYPDIPAGGLATGDAPFAVEVAGDVPDGYIIPFTLTATAGRDIWEMNFGLQAQAPVLTANGMLDIVDNGGNANGVIEPGESFQLWVGLDNTGHSDSEAGTATITSDEMDLTILAGTAACEAIVLGGQGTAGMFTLQVSPMCPSPTSLTVHMVVDAGNGYQAEFDFTVAVGGWFDDMETDLGWTVGALGDNASSGIWDRVDPVGTTYNSVVVQMEDDHTPAPGVNCYVTGNGSPGGTAGANDVDGGKTTLLSPIFDLSDAVSASVSYWRWYTNNAGNNPGEDWWRVDVTSNGIDWVPLEATQATAAVWTEMSFDLTAYITLSNRVQIRFIADDSVNPSLVEAGVDDFLLVAERQLETAVDDGAERVPTKLALGENYPNPFNPKTTIAFDLPATGKVDLTIFDLSGRQVATLVSGELAAGSHHVVWLGRDDDGRQMSSGLYFSRLSFANEVLTRKMVLLK